MSELETMRNHAREMAESNHRADCGRATGVTSLNCGITSEHLPHEWAPTITSGRMSVRGRPRTCYGLCFGCMADDEREGWKRMADELDAYLAPDDGQEALL